jgi:hypothetical protein
MVFDLLGFGFWGYSWLLEAFVVMFAFTIFWPKFPWIKITKLTIAGILVMMIWDFVGPNWAYYLVENVWHFVGRNIASLI